MSNIKEKDFSVCLLYDLYSSLLSEKKKAVFEMSYWQDLSLSEIAEHTGTTRQGVRNLLNRTCQELCEFEKALNLNQIQMELTAIAKELDKTNPEMSEKIKKLI